MLGLIVMPKYFGITGVWLAIPIAELLTLCISVFLNRKLWISWSEKEK